MTIDDDSPIAKAIERLQNRKVALVGEDETFVDFAGEESALRALRAMLSGTDLDAEEVVALVGGMTDVWEEARRLSVSNEFALNGIVVDTFLLGYWTREAMA